MNEIKIIFFGFLVFLFSNISFAGWELGGGGVPPKAIANPDATKFNAHDIVLHIEDEEKFLIDRSTGKVYKEIGNLDEMKVSHPSEANAKFGQDSGTL